MHEITIQAESRSRTGQGTRALRREGRVPGIYYIHGESNIPFSVVGKSLQPLIFTTESHVINLKFADGAEKKCILRDVQFDPVTDLPIHVDLQGLRENEEITLEIPVVALRRASATAASCSSRSAGSGSPASRSTSRTTSR
jgi:large subunit ribosomal protein L25